MVSSLSAEEAMRLDAAVPDLAATGWAAGVPGSNNQDAGAPRLKIP